MKMLVLGAGLQGCAAAHNLLQHDSVQQVTIADLHPNRLPTFLQPYLGRDLVALRVVVEGERDGGLARFGVRIEERG